MKIRYMSDLHIGRNPYSDYTLPVMADEDNTVLILAGDIGDEQYHVPFLYDVCSRHKEVVYVFGNHEYYNGCLSTARQTLIDAFPYYPSNLHILHEGEVIIDDIVFLGTPLWTDFDNENPNCMYDAKYGMNDYKGISVGTRDWFSMLTPDHILYEHKRQLSWLKIRLDHWKALGKIENVIVVTHHGPTWLSISPRFVGDSLNGCFVSDLSSVMDQYAVPYWFHGHVHDQIDYMMYDTRVLCNPKGYVGRHGQETSVSLFKPFATVTIGDKDDTHHSGQKTG
jgi:hypothetical protein